jgi:hypothetical protein
MPFGLQLKRGKLFIQGILILCISAILPPQAYPDISSDDPRNQSFSIHADFHSRRPKTIAVLPMANLSFESEAGHHLYSEVYRRLQSKGYLRISVDTVMEKMRRLGIQTPGQIAGISPERLGRELNCDAVIIGQIDQSASIHGGAYDAIVVSCSLGLMDCRDGEIIWRCEQWRTAHRQWALDPLNMFLNAIIHHNSSREERVSWLTQEMLRTLPSGPVKTVKDDLLNQALEIEALPVSE